MKGSNYLMNSINMPYLHVFATKVRLHQTNILTSTYVHYYNTSLPFEEPKTESLRKHIV